jgi:D-aminopeptidase
MPRPRLRDLGITIGHHPPGRDNAITDVPGVLVGHTTLIYDTPRVARTGVTVIVPRGGGIHADHCAAAFHSFNGNGELTGSHWVAESGLLGTPIAITNTHQVGVARDALVAYEVAHNPAAGWLLPVVAETYDGWLNDIDAFHLTQDHVFAALAAAAGGPVAEGNVGGGTGMICHGFKGGIGTASRLVSIGAEDRAVTYTLGALVQANYGDRRDLRVDGVSVGRALPHERVPLPVPVANTPLPAPPAPGTPSSGTPPAQAGSIIVVIATDAPLLPVQCRRLAQRATVGLARAGGVGYNGSGDLFLAFATGNHIPAAAQEPIPLHMLPHHQMNVLFEATAEAVEEAILNALCAAETMAGFKGRTVHALPLDELKDLVHRERTNLP